MFRFGSKPNQAPVTRYLREFLDEYAAAGNELMEGKHPGERTERLQNLATRISMDLDDQDPENNGRAAQHYSDIAMAMEQAALVGEEVEGDNPVDDHELESDTPRPTTVSQAVAASGEDPWGGR